MSREAIVRSVTFPKRMKGCGLAARVACLAFLGLVFLATCTVAAGPIAGGSWNSVLERYVSGPSVDYRALAADRGGLDEFLRSASVAELAGESHSDVTAFWINVYNAAVLKFVLDRYPAVESVMEVDGFFDEQRIPIAGRPMTLDEIEDQAMADGDPRIHFALVCAARSCPDLRAEPYTGRRLRSQLEEQTREFLADTDRGVRLDREHEILWVSTLFKWYGGDFTGGSTALAYFVRSGIVEWMLPYLRSGTAQAVRSLEPRVRYLEYDWTLNDLSPSAR
jgi:hypothetical protein